jgi:CheY-like chemotaxis protein
MSRRRVLFVDDNQEFLQGIREIMLALSENTWEVLLAEGAGPALGLLQQQPVDLIVVDLQMPAVDGIQLLQLLQRRYPVIPRAVLTGAITEANRAACLSNGAELCLEKPTAEEGFKHLYQALDGLARPGTEEGFRGILRRVGLSDVIQMECLAANSSVLLVMGADVNGEIYIQSGTIVHAWTGSLQGEAAFYRLLSLRGGQFALHPFVPPVEQTIDVSWEFLVMEAARKVDEAQEQSEAASSLAAAEGMEAAPAKATAPTWLQPTPAHPDAPAAPELSREIDEVLLCSVQGDVLYEWQCPNTDARIGLLEFFSQKSWQIESSLPVGHFDRIEIHGSGLRIVSQIRNERGLFVRSRQGIASGA